jgi:gliding motility associated protien GldN
MMNARNFLVFFISITSIMVSVGQSNLLNAKFPEEIGIKTADQLLADNDKPIEYGYVNDRDILMGKMTWEIIDLSERINFPLYFPVGPQNLGSNRRSLFDVLTKAIDNGEITDVYTDSYFNAKKTFQDIKASLTKIDTTDVGREQKNAGIPISPEYIVRQDLTSQDVTQYKIKGYWYFDKRQSELKYRLIGICPVTPDVYTMNNEEKDYIELFWVFFPSARNVLHEAKSFNDRNSVMAISFDQILNSRRFNAMIYQEENVYGDRAIATYMKDNAQNQLLESDRVKEKIRNFESDMWNY